MGQRKVRLGRVSDVDIRLLRIFQVVVESGGLSAAEVALGIGRSTISTHLADIEVRLGVRLCDRGRRGFALTADGMKVYQASLDLMSSLERFQEEIGALHGGVSGDLRVGYVDNLVWDRQLRLIEALGQFSDVGQKVNLSVYILSPDEIERRLIEGSLNVGISPVMHRLPSLNYRPLFEEVSYLYCGKGHPLFDAPDAQIDDVAMQACSYVRKGYTVTPTFEETNSGLNHHVSAFHVEAIAMLILTGAHIGFLPEHFAQVWRDRGLMRPIKPDHYKAIFEFAAITHKGRSTSPAKTAFLDSLAARASENNLRLAG
jgi:LysR family transcriptional regulator, transcriptional activator for bauABCD operon